jgi:hypothetical protein
MVVLKIKSRNFEGSQYYSTTTLKEKWVFSTCPM